MATMIVRLRVRDFDAWKAVFDSMAGAREEHGFSGASIHRDPDDAARVVIVHQVESVAAARAWAGSEDLRSAMRRAGVEGVPEIDCLEDVP